MLVPLPSRREQDAVVDLLLPYDDLIANNKRRIALLEQSARLLFQEWFFHLRYPGHEHDKIVDGVPDGWERVRLGDVLTLKRGYDLPDRIRSVGSIPVVSSSGVTGYHNEKRATGPAIVTGRYGTLGAVYYIDEDCWPLNTALYVSDMKGHPPLFLAHFLEHCLRASPGGKAAVPGVNRNDLHAGVVLAPPKALMAAFHDLVTANFDQKKCLSRAANKAAEARDLLLPRLMDGRISV